MANLLNTTNLGMSMALFLATDTYDHEPEGAPNDDLPIISVTQLLKPTKALILSSRIPEEDVDIKMTSLTKSRIGSAIHDRIEYAFTGPQAQEIMQKIGVPNGVRERIVINPDEKHLQQNPNAIPIYLEKRAYRKITASNGQQVWISGKFDQVIAGRPEDHKSTGVYSYIKADRSDTGDYGAQMGLYKWLNPKIITADVGQINFIFTDWKASDVSRIKDYPAEPVIEMPVNLMDETAAEEFIRRKVDEIIANRALPEADMIRCDESELWRSPDVYKYYSNPESAKLGKRATKNFEGDYAGAMAHKSQQGKGVVVAVKGEVKRCGYCDAAPLCVQRMEYQTE